MYTIRNLVILITAVFSLPAYAQNVDVDVGVDVRVDSSKTVGYVGPRRTRISSLPLIPTSSGKHLPSPHWTNLKYTGPFMTAQRRKFMQVCLITMQLKRFG